MKLSSVSSYVNNQNLFSVFLSFEVNSCIGFSSNEFSLFIAASVLIIYCCIINSLKLSGFTKTSSLAHDSTGWEFRKAFIWQSVSDIWDRSWGAWGWRVHFQDDFFIPLSLQCSVASTLSTWHLQLASRWLEFFEAR